ncbi:MAG: hypothetical protein ACKVZJ_10880 [Phycisphaerales bacterium]
MRIDLHGGYYWSERYGFGRVTNMFDADGDDTADPDDCAACVVYLGPGKWLNVPVREWEKDEELAC